MSQVTDKLYHFNQIMLYLIHLARAGFKLTNLMVKGTDSTGSCKSNYHTIPKMNSLPPLPYDRKAQFNLTTINIFIKDSYNIMITLTKSDSATACCKVPKTAIKIFRM